MATMSDLCAHLRNWFIRHTDMKLGMFTIADGEFTPPLSIENGRYFRIIGSVLNDGVYKMSATLRLTDETFSGAVWLMRVPPEVDALLTDINTWETQYGAADASPYQSESFGNYSYTKAGGSSSGSVDSLSGWQKAFSARLAKWRKLG